MIFGEDEVFVDGGCFDFDTSVIFIRKMNELGLMYKRIYAFELDRVNVQKCKEKLKQIEADNIEVLPLGLWSTDDNLVFEFWENDSSHLSKFESIKDLGKPLWPSNTASERVKVVTLDNCIDEKVTFIKMDIEGVELEALKGAEHILLKE